MLVAVFAIVTATFQPARPAVGDPIAIEFKSAVTLDPSTEYEVVSRQGNRVVVRTFEPRPFSLSGTAEGVRFRNLRIPVRSVLKKDDDLQPAPLAPPREVPWPEAPWVAIGAAAACAIAAWTAVGLARRRHVRTSVPAASPAEIFRREVGALRGEGARGRRWAALADATRRFLAATRPALGSELTTTEVLPRLFGEERVVETILRQGDLEKFSPRGAAPEDFDRVAAGALDLAEPSTAAGEARA